MRLKQVTYTNYKQHRKLTIDLDANIVAIIGKNGKGKSNAIGGIQFALTGEQPGFTKEKLTTWGTKNGNVELRFKHNATDFILERSTSSSAASLDYAGKHIQGISPVNAELLSLIGADPELLKQSVFVNQAKIDAVLFSPPAERELAFQKLVGIGTAAKTNEGLGAIISALAKPTDYSTIIATLTSELDSWGKLLAAAQQDIQGERGKLNELGITDVAEERGFLETLKATQSAVTRYKEAAYRQGLAKAALDAAMAERQMPVSEFDDEDYNRIKNAYDMAVMENESLQLLGRQLNEYQGLKARVAETQQVLDEVSRETSVVDNRKADIATTQATIQEKQNTLARASVDLNSLKSLIAAANSNKGLGGACPLCGSPVITVSAENMQRYKDLGLQITALQSDIQVLTGDVRSSQIYVDNYTAKLGRATTTLEIASKQFKSYQNSAVLDKSDMCLQRIKHGAEELTRTTRAFNEATQSRAGRDAAARYNSDIVTRQGKAQATYDSAAAITTSLFTSDVKDAIESGVDVQKVIDDTYQKIRDYDALLSRISGLDGNINIYSGKCDTCKTSLRETLVKRDQEAGYVKKLEVLNTVRNWFHYKNGPHAVVVDVMKRITPNVNFFLAKLAAPFSVIADYDTVGFKYMMTDGSVNPTELPTAECLSGAQKNMLALAFRLSCYCMFSAKLGVLVLDEPTAHLDSDNVGKFGELLQRLQVMAREMNLQIIVVTHHAEILPFCDKTIVIGQEPAKGE